MQVFVRASFFSPTARSPLHRHPEQVWLVSKERLALMETLSCLEESHAKNPAAFRMTESSRNCGAEGASGRSRQAAQARRAGRGGGT